MSSIILSKKNKLDEVGYIVIQYTKDGKTKRKSLKFKMTEPHFNKTFENFSLSLYNLLNRYTNKYASIKRVLDITPEIKIIELGE